MISTPLHKNQTPLIEREAWGAAAPSRVCGGAGSAMGPRRDHASGHTQGDLDRLYPATVPSIDQAINEGIEGLLIPGMGDPTTKEYKIGTVKVVERCGDTNPHTKTVTCSRDPSHFRKVIGGTTCGRRECPICWTTWLNREKDRVGFRIDGYRQFDRFPPRHLIFSVRDGDLDLAALQEMPPKETKRILDAYFIMRAEQEGCHGGAIILHFWRTTDLVPRDLEDKKWAYVRKRGKDRFKDLTYFSPHAHIAGYGYLKKVEKGEENFRYYNRGPLETRDDIERWAAYALSHAPVIEGCHAVKYFGSCGYRQLRPIWKATSLIELVCPECGAPLVQEGTNEIVLMKRTVGEWERPYMPRNTVGSDPP